MPILDLPENSPELFVDQARARVRDRNHFACIRYLKSVGTVVESDEPKVICLLSFIRKHSLADRCKLFEQQVCSNEHSSRVLKTLLQICKRVQVTSKDPGQFLPTSIRKSYFMLSRPERAVLDIALQKYRAGRLWSF